MSLQLPFGLRVLNQLPADDKYLNNGIPYTGTSQVNSLLLIGVRHTGLTVNIGGVEYWYATGITNSALVQKSSGGSGISTANNGLTKNGTNVRLGGALTGNTTITGAHQLVLGTFATPITDFKTDVSNSFLAELSSGIEYAGFNFTPSLLQITKADASFNNESAVVMSDNFVTINSANPTGQSSITIDNQQHGHITLQSNLPGFAGAEYDIDYSANFKKYSLVDKHYVTGLTTTSGIQTANNGLTKSGQNVRLGGSLTGNTFINLNTHNLTISGGSGSAALSFAANGGIYFEDPTGGGTYFDDLGGGGVYFNDKAGGGIQIGSSNFTGGGVSINGRNSSTIDLTIYHNNTNQFALSLSDSSGARFIDNRTGTTAHGLQYAANYAANFTARSIPDVAYVTGLTGAVTVNNGLTKSGSNIHLGGALTGDTFIGGNNLHSITFGDAVAYTANTINVFSVRSSGYNEMTAYDNAGNHSQHYQFPNTYQFNAVNSGGTSSLLQMFSNSVSLSINDTHVGSSGFLFGTAGFNLSAQNSGNTESCSIDYSTSISRFFVDVLSDNQDALIRLKAENDTTNTFTEIKIGSGLSGLTISDGRTGSTQSGIQYVDDYSTNYTDRSLVDKGWVLSQVGSPVGFYVTGTSFTATTNTSFVGVSGTSASQIYLPLSPTAFKPYYITDIKGNASTINITVNGNGKLIQGSSTALIDSDYGSITFIYNSFNWSVVSSF